MSTQVSKLPGVAELLNHNLPVQPYRCNEDNAETAFVHHLGSPVSVASMEEHVVTPSTEDSCGTPEATSMGFVGGSKCNFSRGCTLESPDRRVVSHFFGRNKRETRCIPAECWVNYCRQHYQRAKYRLGPGQFAVTQMRLVRATVENLEKWGGVASWNINLRKRALDLIAKEDYQQGRRHARVARNSAHCKERAILDMVGKEKSFNNVYNIIDTVEDFVLDHNCPALEFEVVPQFRPAFLKQRAFTK